MSPLALSELVVAAGTSGVTLLGGEPFDQPGPLGHLAAALRHQGLTVMTFTGYRLETLRRLALTRHDIAGLLNNTDLLVDGPFLADRVDTKRPWLGSTNQRMSFLSGRLVEASVVASTTSDKVEVRVRADGRVEANGWATTDALETLLRNL